MAKESILVLDGDQKVPFLRGMVTHSLIERGLNFQEAYELASQVRELVRHRKVIAKSELRALIDEMVFERFGTSYARLSPNEGVLTTGLRVTGETGVMPFSKGLLTQSLQASGLEPSAAYDVAREIEEWLIRRGLQEVTRDRLRRLIYETIYRKHGASYAERYLLWRCFKAPDKPLILLFGGATGTGKSTVAAEIAHRLGIQKVVGTDIIRQMMRMMFSFDLLPVVHQSSYEAWKDRCLGSEPDPNDVIEAFKEQALRVLVGIRAMVERAVQENFSIVLEGVHLIPGMMGLQRFEQQAHIVPVVISTLNQEEFLKRFPTREREAVNRSARRYRDNFERILKIQEYILEMAESNQTPIIENVDFDQTVASILSVVSNTLRDKLQIDREELIARACTSHAHPEV
jgi:2-phosphoglycerate kinase